MSDPRWEQLQDLFDRGVQLTPAERAAWLDSLAIDTGLRKELSAMLEADAASDELTKRFDAALAPAVTTATAGMRLGPYRLLQELGSGGMGMVYLAERADDQFRQQVAIKLIRGFADAVAARQLRHERQILAELVHPNIARLLDGGETPQGQPYLVMEYVPGEPVTEAARRMQLSLVRRVELLRDVAQAVHYAHQRLVVHRDIKPANVLLREDGRPLLLDFGIAKLVDPESRTSDATQPWFTPAYASPEQRRGQTLSTATDVYALGLLLSELLTGQQPEPDENGEITPPSQVPGANRKALRADLDLIVLRATAPDPARRYPSAEALADDLQRYLAGRPVSAVPDSFGYRLGKLVRRNPLATMGAAVAVLLLVAGGARLADERNRALRAEAQAQQEAATADAVTGYLVELFREADPERARGGGVTPLALVDRGHARIAAESAMSPAQRARLLGAFGEIYVNLGQPEKASAALEQALDSDPNLGAAARAELLQQLALAAEALQRFADSERHYAAAAELLRTVDLPHELANALAGRGLAASRNDNNEEAERSLREAVSLQARIDGPRSPTTLRYQVYLSEALFNAGRSEDARQLMDTSIAGLRAQLAPDDIELISALGFYGVLLRELGENAEAERVFLEILAQRRSLLQRDSYKIAVVHNNLGRVYYNQGRTLDAIAQFRAAYEAGARPGADQEPSRGLDMLNLGSLYEEVGDYDQAEPLMRAGAAIMEAHADDVGQLLVVARQNLGRLLMLAGQAEESRYWLERPIDERDDRDWAFERARQRVHLADWERRYGSPERAWQYLREAEERIDDLGGPESPRIAAIERIKGQLALGAGDTATARGLLESASERLARAVGPRYVGVGELRLELASLALIEGDLARAAEELRTARQILDPVMSGIAPQRKRLNQLERALTPLQ